MAMVGDAGTLITLGVFIGVLVLVTVFSAIVAGAYRERSLLTHAAATLMGVLAVVALIAGRAEYPEAAVLVALGLAGLQLLDLVSHAGALRQPRRWLVGASVALMPALGLASLIGGWHLLLPGLAAWATVTAVLMFRAWPQSQPWVTWLVPGQLALAAAAAWLGWRSLDREPDPALPLAAMLAVWSAAVYLATVWRSRIYGETRVRIDARATVDPLTGLATPLMFHERVRAVRSLMRRYGHPSVLLLVHIDNLSQLSAEFGPELAESALLVAANRVREALGDGDVAARLSHSRIAVLAEGRPLADGAANVATRILVAGMKEPLPAAPAVFLQFRVVLAAVPAGDMTPKALLQRLSARMDEQLMTLSERRIVSMAPEELVA